MVKEASQSHLPSLKQSLVSFDGTTSATSAVYRPDRYRDLKQLATALPKSSLKGAGLSYALASAQSDTPSIDLKCFNRFLEFNDSTGNLKVEAGVRLGDALTWSVERGFNIGILPGHPEITVGGCVAFNVHGKSQFSTGNFENIVEALTVFHPDHGEISCSRDQNQELFWLTIGGMGLTGIILDVTLKLTRLKGAKLERTAIPCNNLDDAFKKMAELESKFDYLYSWNNFCRSGKHFGRGVVYAEKFIGDPLKPSFGELKSKLKAVQKRPGFSLFRKETAPIVNRIYELKERAAAGSITMDIGPGTFPIAGKEFYFSLIGKPGFLEYQCIIPNTQVSDALKKFVPLFDRFGINPSLGSTKFFRGKTRHLCFQMDGFCIAIDLPKAGHPHLLRFLSSMDELVIAHGGIVNIAKDSRLSRDAVQKMYPEYNRFWSELQKWDPARRFTNEVRSRLEPLL